MFISELISCVANPDHQKENMPTNNHNHQSVTNNHNHQSVTNITRMSQRDLKKSMDNDDHDKNDENNNNQTLTQPTGSITLNTTNKAITNQQNTNHNSSSKSSSFHPPGYSNSISIHSNTNNFPTLRNSLRYFIPETISSDRILSLERLLGYTGGPAVLLYDSKLNCFFVICHEITILLYLSRHILHDVFL